MEALCSSDAGVDENKTAALTVGLKVALTSN